MEKLHEGEAQTLPLAVRILKSGGVAVIPTETVYGLMTRWDNEEGVRRIYELKRRPAAKRLQMLAPSYGAALHYGVGDSPALRRLAHAFWPGALTVVAPDATHTDSIGLRIPDHPFLLRLLEQCGFPLAATSANLSGEPPAVDCVQAVAGLNGEPDLAIDAGVITTTGGKASTVVSLLGETPVILREGCITLSQLAAVL